MEIDPDIVALNGAAAALEISDIPFNGPVAAVRVGKIDGQLVINPTNSQLKESTLNLIVAGAPQGLVMVEAGAQMIQEDEVLEALFFAQEQLQPILETHQEHGPGDRRAQTAGHRAAGLPGVASENRGSGQGQDPGGGDHP